MKRFSSLFPGLGWRHRDLDSNTFQVTLISWDAWEILLSHGCLVAWRTLASRPSLSSTSSTFSPPLLRWAGPCLPKKPTSAFLGFPCDSAGRNPPAMRETCGRPGLGRSPEEGKGYPLQYSGLENSMYCIALGFTKSQTRLRTFTLLHFSLGERGTLS